MPKLFLQHVMWYYPQPMDGHRLVPICDDVMPLGIMDRKLSHARQDTGNCQIGFPKDSESPVHPPMLEQGPSKLGRVLEPIRDHLDRG